MDISQLSDDKIKALSFDALMIIEQQKNNLTILNTELQNRQKKSMEQEEVKIDATEAVTPEVVETPVEEANVDPEAPQPLPEVSEAQEEAAA